MLINDEIEGDLVLDVYFEKYNKIQTNGALRQRYPENWDTHVVHGDSTVFDIIKYHSIKCQN